MAEERRVDLTNELRSVREGLKDVAETVATSFPEKRVRSIVRESQRRTLLVLWVAVALTAGVLLQLRLNNDTLSEAKVTADFVRDCLQHPERLSQAERVIHCGGTGESGTSRAVEALIEFQKCALLIQPPQRTDENMNSCVARAMQSLARR